MKRVKWIVFAICVMYSLVGYGQDKVDFSKLNSPIIFQGDHKYAYRDPAVVFHDGKFYLYFTLSETALAGIVKKSAAI